MRFLAVLVYPFNPGFMTKYTTTLGNSVYFPSEEEVEQHPMRYAKVLAHEWVHIHDCRRHPLLFRLGYLSPQIGFLVALGVCAALGAWQPVAALVAAVVGSYSSLFLAMKLSRSRGFRLAVFGIVLAASVISCGIFAVWACGWLSAIFFAGFGFLLPWRSAWRSYWEQRGYGMNIALNYWRYGSVQDRTLDKLSRAFTTMAYYRMDPNEKRVLSRFRDTIRYCETGEILEGPEAEPYVSVFEVLNSSGLVKTGAASA